MRTFNFKTVEGMEIPDPIQYIQNKINEDTDTTSFKIYVGCDSLPNKRGTAVYTTVICLYYTGKGGHVIYSRENRVKVYGNSKIERLRNRLWDEIYRVVDIASIITNSNLLEDPRIVDFQIHIDINPNEKYDSNIIHDEVVGYINSLGLDAYAKPNASAATYISDHLCRGKENKMAFH